MLANTDVVRVIDGSAHSCDCQSVGCHVCIFMHTLCAAAAALLMMASPNGAYMVWRCDMPEGAHLCVQYMFILHHNQMNPRHGQAPHSTL